MQKGGKAQEILEGQGLGSRKSGKGGKNKRRGCHPLSVAGAAPLAELPLFHPLSSLLQGLTTGIWSVPVPEPMDHHSTAALMVCSGTGTTSNTVTPLALLPVRTGLPCTGPAQSLWSLLVLNNGDGKAPACVSSASPKGLLGTRGKGRWI